MKKKERERSRDGQFPIDIKFFSKKREKIPVRVVLCRDVMIYLKIVDYSRHRDNNDLIQIIIMTKDGDKNFLSYLFSLSAPPAFHEA